MHRRTGISGSLVDGGANFERNRAILARAGQLGRLGCHGSVAPCRSRQRDYSMSISTRRRFFNQSGRAMVASLVPSLIGKARAAGAERPRIKIGQLGVGHAHASKLSVFRQSADYEIVGLVEPDAELRKRAQSQEIY